ncbi:hypothetical protein [Limnohabitans sp. DM1]|uniref:hypothetical protein n=1 Tax=Limnohabitans sp. DM1 TaxID=1597955 RepID=UPI001E37B7DF|nr:hypothetical protein [Limnohabitans sp. DM1]
MEHALKTIAHRVGSYKDNNSRMADKKWAIQTSSGRIHQQKSLTIFKGRFFCRSPPLWAMGVEHALKTIAHRVGAYKDKNSHMAYKNMSNSNLIGPDPSTKGKPCTTSGPPAATNT